MLAAVICTGLAWGALLAAAGLALWDGFQQVPGTDRAVQVIRWVAGTLLAAGALLAWMGDPGLSAPAPHLALMAALATPPASHRRLPAHWSDALRILPALTLAGASLPWIPGSVEAGTGRPLFAPATLAIAVCAGMGARALGVALSEIATPTPHVEWPSIAAYAMLTLIVGGTALMNLWQRGSAWGGTAGESGLAGAWAAWSATWIGLRQSPRLRAALTVVATALLIVVVVVVVVAAR